MKIYPWYEPGVLFYYKTRIDPNYLQILLNANCVQLSVFFIAKKLLFKYYRKFGTIKRQLTIKINLWD